MKSITAGVVLVLMCLSVAWCEFNHVFVLVVEENVHLTAIFGKGHLADYNFNVSTSTVQAPSTTTSGTGTGSVVSTLQKKGMSWKVYSEDYKKCDLSPSITSKYKYLVSAQDVNSTTCQNIADAAEVEGDANIFQLPTVAFYFPDATNASNPNWLRAFLHPIIGSSEFLKNTMTIILSHGKRNNTRALLIGRDAQAKQEDKESREALLKVLYDRYGIALIDVPSPHPPMTFDRIFFVLLENEPLHSTLKHALMRSTALQGTLLTDFNAIVNPSQPNYIALVAGDTLGVKDDHKHDLPQRSLIDTFEEHGISWKAYNENFPGNCFSDSTSPDGLYWRKHNPFMSFNSVRTNASRCAKIVHSDQLDIDIQRNTLPKYMFYTPNINNDGHDTNVPFSSKWLNSFIVPKLMSQNFMEKTLVVITYDEGVKSDNKIYTLLIGDMVPYGSLDDTKYTHYSLLRLVEDQFKLPYLGRNDVHAVQINASRFYPGDVPVPPMSKMIIIGIALGIVVAVCVISVVVFVITRRRMKKGAFVVLQQTSDTTEEDDDYDENDEEEGMRLPKRKTLVSKQKS